MNLPSEIGIGFGIVVFSGVALFVVKSVVDMSTTLQNRYVELLPYTITSENKSVIIYQDPNKHPNAIPVLGSDNERSGIEFSYSFYLFVNEKTIDGSNTLHNVFTKGYDSNPWPLQSPGVFILGESNTMRVILNSYSTIYNYVDVHNIPLGKWFHVVLNFKKNSLEVHINGKITRKLEFTDSLPYSNYGNITIFNNYNNAEFPISRQNMDTITFSTAITGKLSNLIYTRYALSYTEIQSFYNTGPLAKTVATATDEKPPYLADSWWATQ